MAIVRTSGVIRFLKRPSLALGSLATLTVLSVALPAESGRQQLAAVGTSASCIHTKPPLGCNSPPELVYTDPDTGNKYCRMPTGSVCTGMPPSCGNGTCDAIGNCLGTVVCVAPQVCNAAGACVNGPTCPAGVPNCPMAPIPLGGVCGNQCCFNGAPPPIANAQPCAGGNLCQGGFCVALPPACPAGTPICPTVAIPLGGQCGNQCCPNATTAPVANAQPCVGGNPCQGGICTAPTCAASASPACGGTCAPGTGPCRANGGLPCTCNPPSCGDGVCSGPSETPANCCNDCGPCPAATPVCNSVTHMCMAGPPPPPTSCLGSYPGCGGACPAGGSCHPSGGTCTCTSPTTSGVTTFPMLGVTGGVFIGSMGCVPSCLVGMGLGAGAPWTPIREIRR